MKKSFIVDFWSQIFRALSRLSLFGLVTAWFPGMATARAVDAWVLGHTLAALVGTVVIANIGARHWLSFALVIYGLLRVFEIAVYQINVLLFDEYRTVKAGANYALEGYRRIIILLLHNYAEIILWLACTYTLVAEQFVHKWEGGTNTILGSIYSSFITMTTFGDFDLLPKTNLAAVVLIFHSTVGLFMTLLSLARFIALLPPSQTQDIVELAQIQSGKLRESDMDGDNTVAKTSQEGIV